MPKVSQEHLDARRRQILQAARTLFTDKGFERTSMADIVDGSGLSMGAIYRYFQRKEEIVLAVCEQGAEAFPAALDEPAVDAFLEHVRALSRETGHARLVMQIYAEAALSPDLAAIVAQQQSAMRSAVAALIPDHPEGERIAEAFVALAGGYVQQLATRGDVDPAPFSRAMVAIARS